MFLLNFFMDPLHPSFRTPALDGAIPWQSSTGLMEGGMVPCVRSRWILWSVFPLSLCCQWLELQWENFHLEWSTSLHTCLCRGSLCSGEPSRSVQRPVCALALLSGCSPCMKYCISGKHAWNAVIRQCRSSEALEQHYWLPAGSSDHVHLYLQSIYKQHTITLVCVTLDHKTSHKCHFWFIHQSESWKK